MRENSLIKENILLYLDSKGISKYEFYKKTGVSNGVLSQKNGMSEENTMRFLSEFSDVNASWLLTGKGSMILNQEERGMSMVSEPLGSYSKESATLRNTIPEIENEVFIKQLKEAHEEIGSLKYQLREAKKEIELLKNSSKRVTQ